MNLERAARLALELGDQARRPKPRRPHAQTLACDLYRQSVACSLRGLLLVPDGDAEVERALEAEATTAAPSELSALLEQTPPAVLDQAAGGAENATRLGGALAHATFRSLAEKEESEAAALANDLAGFARSLHAALDAKLWKIERPGVKRWLKISAGNAGCAGRAAGRGFRP
ncbi:MAG: hypothetical protein QM756_25130 [Polyangiaceae bacterium]